MYHLTGIVSTALYGLSIYGLWHQLRLIIQRKELSSCEEATAVISLNYTITAFAAYYVFFLYGASIPRFNHYLVWPRLIAIAISLFILREIARDRSEWASKIAFGSATSLVIVSCVLLLVDRSVLGTRLELSQIAILVIAVILAQGNVHQILRIIRAKATGGISLRAHQLTLVKDLGMIAFGVAMGMETGWPLVVLCGSNALAKGVIISLFLTYSKDTPPPSPSPG